MKIVTKTVHSTAKQHQNPLKTPKLKKTKGKLLGRINHLIFCSRKLKW